MKRVSLVALSLILTIASRAAEITLQPVATGLERPTSIASAGDERLFITEQTGLIRVFDGARLLDEPFADLRELISCCGERGLLSIAFHPAFRDNGLVFISYTDTVGRVTVSRYHISDEDPNKVDPGSATPIVQLLHVQTTHNSGEIAFGPDGYLYLGVGDASEGAEAQNLSDFVGKILRIDVDHGDPYAVPVSNPFAGRDDAVPEIWAYGLRNPWRFSFDRETGDFWIADVGDTMVEEINFQPAGSTGGQNYGWDLMEGPNCLGAANACDTAGLTLPILYYTHDEGCAVIGGYRYRGEMNDTLRGVYLYADYCNGTIWAATPREDGSWTSSEASKAPARVRTFGEDAHGELYIATEDGTLSLIVDSVPRLRAVRH